MKEFDIDREQYEPIDVYISQHQYEEFQTWFTMKVLQLPTYRYGQAFINYFRPFAARHINQQYKNIAPDAGEHLLWNAKNVVAKTIIESHFNLE